MEYLQSIGVDPLLIVLLMSMVPLVELRGGVVVGIAMGLPWTEVLIAGIIGTVLPVPFLILFGRFLLERMERTKLFGGVIGRYKTKLLAKNEYVKKYGPWGLVLFVGIPVPGTGAWSGSVLAVLMNLRMKRAVPAIIAGVVLCGIIMTLASLGLFGAADAVLE